MMEVAKLSQRRNEPDTLKDWRWRTQDGTYLRPMVMTTKHLHNTLVMIWHHRMPDDARIRGYYKRYSFGNFYSRKYLMQAIQVMSQELASRRDLAPWMKVELKKMRDHLRGPIQNISDQKRIGGKQ